ncbi:hypothetical protein TNCV_4207601 [Trichonephila clavipes]|nr:hypothetical protein TNCV_4207601 [Trichonephila clavipes]
MNQKRKSCRLVIERDFECVCGDEDVSKSDGHTCVGGTVVGPPSSLQTHVCMMDCTSNSHLIWGRFLNRFRSIATLRWPPPAKSNAPYAYSEPWVHFRKNLTKQKRNALSSFATVMPMRKRGSLGRETVKSKAVKHTRAAEAPDEKRARLQADQVRHSLARAAESPEQYQVRLQSQQVRQNASRAAETPEQRQSRLQEDQVRHTAARAAETPIQHLVRLLGLRKQRKIAITLKWKAQMHDGFMYNPRNN